MSKHNPDGHKHHHHEHEEHSHEGHAASSSINSMAVSATLHCLTGCAIGEITGLTIGTIIGLSAAATIAFLFGYSLSMIPLLKSGLSLKKALPIILAADTLSILTMEIVDNAVMAAIPGAMDAGLVNPLFWISMTAALTAAFFVAVPVNRYLLQRGKGHALVHEYHGHAN
jgi:hypothetical protein